MVDPSEYALWYFGPGQAQYFGRLHPKSRWSPSKCWGHFSSMNKSLYSSNKLTAFANSASFIVSVSLSAFFHFALAFEGFFFFFEFFSFKFFYFLFLLAGTLTLNLVGEIFARSAKMQQQRLKQQQQALIQQSLLQQQSLYHHPGLLAPPQVLFFSLCFFFPFHFVLHQSTFRFCCLCFQLCMWFCEFGFGSVAEIFDFHFVGDVWWAFYLAEFGKFLYF